MSTNNIQNANHSFPIASVAQTNKVLTPVHHSNILERVGHIVASVEQKRDEWGKYSLRFFDRVNLKLDRLPNFRIQDEIDDLGCHIESMFAPLGKFNEWLNQNGFGTWYRQLAIFLVKLPLRAARNILQMLYRIVRGCLYSTVHPLKSLVHLAKLIDLLLIELTKPETWSKIGGGGLGASFGQSLVTGNPLSVVGIGIGAACLLGGLSISALRAALLAQTEKGGRAWGNFTHQLKQLPETALTGFFMGVMIGAVQNAVRHRSAASHDKIKGLKVTTYEEAKRYVDEFLKEHNLPTYSSIQLKNGEIIITWTKDALQQLQQSLPYFSRYPLIGYYKSFSIDLNLSNVYCTFDARVWMWDAFEDLTWTESCEQVGITGLMYPLPQAVSFLPHANSGAVAVAAIAQEKL